MIKTIMFDLGNVVVRTDFDALYAKFAARLRIPPHLVRNYRDKHVADLILGQTKWKHFQADMEKAVRRKLPNFNKVWLEEGLKARTANEPLLAIIKKLRKSYKIGAVSNLHEGRWLIDKQAKLYAKFDYTVLSCRDHVKKPNGDFYHLALSRADAHPDEAILVDDKPEQILGAEQLGIHTIPFSDNARLVESLQHHGVTV
ncbi:MAG TPA: HAD family phosphatase [Verrucomicrobiae bacterium]|nr:HAD family phosphatase [Verrucomicrobiae bacterium]